MRQGKGGGRGREEGGEGKGGEHSSSGAILFTWRPKVNTEHLLREQVSVALIRSQVWASPIVG